MLRETWNWILGLICIFFVALIWIAASFVVQSVVDSGISPFLISYICNSLFVVYIPIVELLWWIRRYWGDPKLDKSVSKKEKFQLSNSEKAKLLESAATSSDSDSGDCKPYVIEIPQNEVEELSDDASSSDKLTKRLLSRSETAKISILICPVWFLAQFTFNLSLKYTTVTSNTILSSTSTLFTFLVSVAFLGESFTMLKIASIALCMGGTIVVALGDSESIAGSSAPHPVIGDLFCLVSAMFYACYTSLIRKKFPDETEGKEEVSTAMFLGYLGLFNALMFFPIVLLLHFTGVEPIHRLTTTQLSLIIGKGMFDNVLSDYLWANAVILTTTTIATAGLTLQVPIAAVVDSLRGHKPGTLNILGACAVLAGFFGINQSANCCMASTTEETSTSKVEVP